MLILGGTFLLILGWLIPNHYPPWNSVYNESCTALALLLFTWHLGRQWLRSRLTDVAWAACFVAGIPAIHLLVGLLFFTDDATISSTYLLGFGVAIACGHLWQKSVTGELATVLSVATLVAALLSTFLAAIQVTVPEALGIWSIGTPGARATANLGQPNNLATLLGFGTLSILWLKERQKLSTITAVFVLAVLLAGTALTQSRTCLLFGPTVVLGLLLAKRRGVRLHSKVSFVFTATVVQWFLMLAWPALQSSLFLGAQESVAQRGLETPRLQMWSMLWHAATLSPWHGYGWLQVGAAELAVVNDYPPVNELWLHGHNLFLELILWCGFPVGLVLIGATLYWYMTRVSRVRTLGGTIGMLMVTIFGVHAMLELPHHYAYFLVPIGLWIGIVEAEVARAGSVPARFNLLPVGLALVLTLASLKDYPAVEEDFRLVRFESLRIGSIHATEPAPDAPFLSSLTGFLRFARTKPEPGMSDGSLRFMEAAAYRYPYGPSLARLASCWALNGRLADATSTFIKIRQIFGDGNYMKLKNELHEQIAEGAVNLQPLYESLPK